MGMSPETIASDARSRDGLPRRAAGPAAPVPGVRCWVLAVLCTALGCLDGFVQHKSPSLRRLCLCYGLGRPLAREDHPPRGGE